MENWKTMLDEELKSNKETWEDIVQNTMTDDDMEKKFDSGFGCKNGIAFTVWTHNNVYFPVCYDGSEWIGSVSRNPDNIPTEHQGGG